MSRRTVQYFILKNVALFGLVGSIGFVIDTSVLYAIKNHLGLYPARLCSFLAAVMTTWLLNRTLTFGRQRSGISWWRELIRYFLVMLVGGMVNYLTFWAATVLSPYIYHYPVVGVAIGGLAGMISNYTVARFFVFNKM